MPARPLVYLNELTTGYPDNVSRGLEHVGFFRTVASGSAVFLKPNLTYPEYRPGVMTSFDCVKAVTECLVNRGYKVIIGEADSGGYNPFPMDAVFEQVGLNKLAADTGARLVNMTLTEPEYIQIKVGFRSLSVPVSKVLLREAQGFISLPVPKVHLNTLVSMSIKNQWGCIQDPGERLKLHPFFAEVMFELNRRLPQAHSIIDGRVGLNRTGPLRGDPVPLNWLLAANDLVAADRVCLRLMQIDERRVKYLDHFREQGWWTPWEDIQVNCELEAFIREKFYLRRQWTDLPGLACFKSSFMAWLGYRSPLAGLAHRMLYLFREPFYDAAAEGSKLQARDAAHRAGSGPGQPKKNA
jgi:uncharacterized protein (DUF362 family)